METRHCNGFARLELLVILAVLVLIFQLFPSLSYTLIAALDVHTWSRGAWIGLNAAVIAMLFGIRFRLEIRQLLATIRSPRRRIPSADQTSLSEHGSALAYEDRVRRDAEWRERAKKRRPFL